MAEQWKLGKASFLAPLLIRTVMMQATSCSLGGSFAGYLYLKNLMQAVEGYTADSEVPLFSAQQVSSQPWRALSIAFAVYRCDIARLTLKPAVSLLTAIRAETEAIALMAYDLMTQCSFQVSHPDLFVSLDL